MTDHDDDSGLASVPPAPTDGPAVPTALAKFSTQLDPALIAGLKAAARSDGRHLQAVLDEAVREYLDRRQTDAPRRHVMLALAQSLAEFDRVYRELSR
jgi:hypothetical protein